MLIRNLALVSYAQSFTIWTYLCDDLEKALAADYFLSVCDMLRENDLIIIRAKRGTAQRYVAHCTETSVVLKKLL